MLSPEPAAMSMRTLLLVFVTFSFHGANYGQLNRRKRDRCAVGSLRKTMADLSTSLRQVYLPLHLRMCFSTATESAYFQHSKNRVPSTEPKFVAVSIAVFLVARMLQLRQSELFWLWLGARCKCKAPPGSRRTLHFTSQCTSQDPEDRSQLVMAPIALVAGC